jgi:HSP20 family molecular chaperone IbpA
MSHPALRRDPFPFGSVFYTPFAAPFRAPRPARAWQPAVEIVRDEKDALIRVEVPGLNPESDIKVEVSDGRLIVSGEKREQHSADKDGITLREVRYGSFRRAFALPNGVTESAVSASYDAGVLTVRVADAYAEAGVTRIPVQAA